MKVLNIRHTGIVVKNLEESLKFYLNLGFVPHAYTEEDPKFISRISAKTILALKTVKLVTPNKDMIELLDYREDTVKEICSMFQIGVAHIAFTVDNLDEIYNNLLREGIEFNSGPQLSPNKYAKVVFCKAPEGSFIELVEVL